MAKTATQVSAEFRDHWTFAVCRGLRSKRSPHESLRDIPARRRRPSAGQDRTLSSIRRLPRNLWDSTTLTDAGTPITEMTIALPDDRLVDVLASMASHDGRMVVVNPADRLAGTSVRAMSPQRSNAAVSTRTSGSPRTAI